MEFEFSKRISGVKASAIREILKMMNDPQIISFGGGNPASETFPGVLQLNNINFFETLDIALFFLSIFLYFLFVLFGTL